MTKKQRTINIRLPEAERDIIAAHAEKYGRTITDVIREFIRSLKGR